MEQIYKVQLKPISNPQTGFPSLHVTPSPKNSNKKIIIAKTAAAAGVHSSLSEKRPFKSIPLPTSPLLLSNLPRQRDHSPRRLPRHKSLKNKPHNQPLRAHNFIRPPRSHNLDNASRFHQHLDVHLLRNNRNLDFIPLPNSPLPLSQ